MATLLKKYVGTDEPKENGDVLKCECTSNHASPTGLGKWTLDGVSRRVMANGCPSIRRYLVVAVCFLLVAELKIAFGQHCSTAATVTLNAEIYPKYSITPNFPHKYPRNACCHWEIIAPVGFKIKFEVEESFIEAKPSPRCNGDYAEVFDHRNSSLEKFCGSNKPVVISPSNVLHVIFVSDSVVETKGMKFSYVANTSFVLRPSTTTTDAPKKKDKETNKVALFAAMGGAVLCSVLFVTVLCVCLHTKRCGCPCGSRNTAQVVEPFDSTSHREHRNVSRTNSIFTSHLSRSVGSLPNDEVLSLRILSPPPYSSGPPPSIDSPSDSSSPPPPYSFNDPHPDVVVQSDSLPSYPGEVSRY